MMRVVRQSDRKLIGLVSDRYDVVTYCTYCMDYCCPSHQGELVIADYLIDDLPVCEKHLLLKTNEN